MSDEWNRFRPFLEWSLANGWEEGLTLDRIDTNGDYSPGNCRWATQKEQQNNRRDNIPLTIDGVTKNLKCWSDEANVPKSTILIWYHQQGPEEAARRIKNALCVDYVGHSYAKGRSVYCITNGQTYSTIRELARSLDLERKTLTKRINLGLPYKGFEFRWLD